MTWVKLDDNFPEHPKTEKLSDAAFRLLVSSWCYCGRNLTDGAIPASWAQRLTATASRKTVQELVDAGFWHPTADGYEAHDFLDRNPTRAEVMEEREKGKERAKRSRERRANVRRDDDRTSARSSPAGSGDPSRPVPKHSVSSSIEPQGSPATDDDERIALTAEALGLADHQRALHDGVDIRNTRAHLASCIAARQADARTAAAAHPDATVEQLVEIVEPPPKPDRANPHVPTWEETQARQAAEAAETNLSAEERAAAVAAVKATLAERRDSETQTTAV